MTEDEWLACVDFPRLMAFLRGDTGAVSHPGPGWRRFRLLACACCRRVRDRLADARSRAALGVIERYADREVADEDRLRAARMAADAFVAARGRTATRLAKAVYDVTSRADGECARPGFLGTPSGILRALVGGGDMTAAGVERIAQCVLLHDIFGNPFRRVPADPAWLTSAVVGIAGGIYAEYAFDRLPILADALEEAGCADSGVLGHCRGPGPHARGCWVVDLVLGRA